MPHYILMDEQASSSLTSCHTHHMTDINTSDHLPITACMTYEACMVDHAVDSLHQSRINWDKAEREGLLEGYMHEVQQMLAP